MLNTQFKRWMEDHFLTQTIDSLLRKLAKEGSLEGLEGADRGQEVDKALQTEPMTFATIATKKDITPETADKERRVLNKQDLEKVDASFVMRKAIKK